MNSYTFSVLVVLAMLHLVAPTVLISTAAATTYSVGALGAAIAGVVAGVKAATLLGGRHRRQVSFGSTACLPFANPELYLSLARSANSQDCGRRFVCELQDTVDDDLTEDEKLIKNVFRLQNNPLTGNNSATDFFIEAGLVGAAQGLVGCERTFIRCPFDRRTLYLIFLETQGLTL